MEHYFNNVPGFAAFRDLYFQAVREGKDGQVFVEVGSWLGRSAALMGVEIANSGKAIDFYCVDPWTDGGPGLRHKPHFRNLGVKEIYPLFLKNIEPVKQHVKPLRMTSVEASKKFADGSVDFIMIDGDHSYEGIRADIDAWLPKMKPGGWFTGDDYLRPGVVKAVQETFGDRAKITVRKPHVDPNKSSSYWQVRL